MKTKTGTMETDGMKKRKPAQTGLALLFCLSLAACATAPGQQAGTDEVYDPLENVNRATFAFNDTLDQAFMEPVARGYRAVVPKPARTGLRNFLRNLKTPVNAANQLLQGDVEGMAHDITRGLINTTIGIGGLIDVAKDTGLEYEQEDFGQTLAVWGVGNGPYLVLPLFGPSSFRDTAGMVADYYADPLRLYLDNTDQEEWSYVRFGATALDRREELLDVLADLRKNSLDYYATVRSAYIQRRDAQIRDENPDNGGGAAIPDYDNVDGDATE